MKLSILSEAKGKAAVAVIEYHGKVLLGQSKADDDRKGMWCFPGGHIRKGEAPQRAAVREAKEETGVTCRVVNGPLTTTEKPTVQFFHCKCSTETAPKPNNEFNAMGWFTSREMRGLKLYHNVRDILGRFDIV